MMDSRGRSIVFNGEIFNWPEIRVELESVGYQFHTATDTEVILAAYDRWGPECVPRFNGFWAFAIFDPTVASGILFFSRDRFGIKPLYYYMASNVLVFASEIAPIFAYLNIAPEPDMQELAEYLVFARSHENARTLYRNVLELEPACNLTVDLGLLETKIESYWSLPNTTGQRLNESLALDRFSELVEDSVRLRLRSDRESALTLSGGVDSSVVAVAASRVAEPGAIRAFTSTFPQFEGLDESAYAASVAKNLGLEHIKVNPGILDIRREEAELTRHQELMYVNFSMLVNWAVVRSIRDHGIVVYLTGQGGDECCLGYERYLPSWYVQQLRARPYRAFLDYYDVVRNTRLSALEFFGYLLYFPFRKIRALRYRREASEVFSDSILRMAKSGPLRVPTDIRQLQRLEITGSQLRRLLRYDDRTASAFGLEARPALLDHRLVEFAFSLDTDLKIRGGWTKYIMRKYLERAGLPEVAWRKHKLGYPAPNASWLLKLWDNAIVRSPDALTAPVFKQGLRQEEIPQRMRFLVFNLVSTSRQLGWDYS